MSDQPINFNHLGATGYVSPLVGTTLPTGPAGGSPPFHPVPLPPTPPPASHAKLYTCLALLVILSGVWLFYGYTKRQAAVADARYNAAQTIAATLDKQNKAIQVEIEHKLDDLMTQNQKLQSQVTVLSGSIDKRDTVLVQKTAQVPKMSPTELSHLWGSLTNEPPPLADLSGAFQVPAPVAQKSVDALLAVPVLESDKEDLIAQIGDYKQVIANLQDANGLEKQAHSSDNAACTADKLVLTTEITKVKKDARRGKIRSFFYGYAAGFASGFVVAFKVL